MLGDSIQAQLWKRVKTVEQHLVIGLDSPVKNHFTCVHTDGAEANEYIDLPNHAVLTVDLTGQNEVEFNGVPVLSEAVALEKLEYGEQLPATAFKCVMDWFKPTKNT